MSCCNLVTSKDLGHEQDLFGEDKERPFVRKVKWLEQRPVHARRLGAQSPGTGAPCCTPIRH